MDKGKNLIKEVVKKWRAYYILHDLCN